MSRRCCATNILLVSTVFGVFVVGFPLCRTTYRCLIVVRRLQIRVGYAEIWFSTIPLIVVRRLFQVSCCTGLHVPRFSGVFTAGVQCIPVAFRCPKVISKVTNEENGVKSLCLVLHHYLGCSRRTRVTSLSIVPSVPNWLLQCS